MTWITSAIHTTSKGCSLCLHQYPRRVHLYQWGCISLLLFASPPRAFSLNTLLTWITSAIHTTSKGCSLCLHQYPRRVHLYQWGCISLLSLHLLRVHSLLNPHPDDVDYLSDPYHVQRMFSLLAPVPQKSSSLPVGLHLSSPLCISSACILF